MATLVAGAVVFLGIAFAAYSTFRQHKKGGCGGCPGCDGSHKKSCH